MTSLLERTDSRLTAELVERYVDHGDWGRETLRGLLATATRLRPQALAAADRSPHASGPGRRLTFSELDAETTQVASGLARLHIGPGDGVAVMLPNSARFATTIFAILERGAVYTGIPVAYGERDVRAILQRSGATAIVITERFRSVRHLELIRRLRADLPRLRHVIVDGDAVALDERVGELPFDRLIGGEPAPLARVSPDAVCHIGFTSGTTGEPKGVMNTHQTLEAVMRRFVAHIGRGQFGEEPRLLVASPIGHHTGFLWGVLLGAYLGAGAIYLDSWDPEAVLDIMRGEDVTALFGAPTFLQDLIRVADAAVPSFRTAVVAGAPVPRGLPEEAAVALGCRVIPAWGMTEWGIGIACHPGLGAEASRTDGVPVESCEVRIVDASGLPAVRGEVGRLQIRGPGLFVGYLQRPDAMAECFDNDGWFDTGDTASIDEQGYVSLRGRTKDIIIRGGENIPVTEVESLLFAHPGIADVAVVGVPHARLGETAVAVVVPVPGTDGLDLAELCAYLLAQGLSKHFLPERLEIVDALPKTSSGKIRKVEIRERLAAEAQAACRSATATVDRLLGPSGRGRRRRSS